MFHIAIEEESLERALGYPYFEYKKRVRGRMIPGLPVQENIDQFADLQNVSQRSKLSNLLRSAVFFQSYIPLILANFFFSAISSISRLLNNVLISWVGATPAT